MSDTHTTATLISEIRQRFDALEGKTSPEVIAALVKEQVEELNLGDEFVRKIQHNVGDARLEGSKFGGQGLGVGDIELLFMITDSAWKRGINPNPPSEALRNAFHAISEGDVLDAVSAEQRDAHQVEQMYEDGKLDQRSFEKSMANVRAMDTAESGYGSQLVGAQYVSNLWAGAKVESRIWDLIPSFPMSAPTAYLPVAAAPPEMFFVSENTANNSSNYGTSKTGSNRVQVDAKKFIIHQMWSGEMEEDSIVNFLSFLQVGAQNGLAYYSDSLILNGDTTNAGTGNINEDDADPTDTDHFLAWDGLRHVGLVDNTSNGTDHSNAAVTWDSLVDLRKLMLDATYHNDWGHPSNPADLLFVVNPALGDDLVKLDEVISMDKYGLQATVLTGEVGNIARHPVISSIAMKLTEADGKVPTALNGDRQQAVLFNRNAFTVGTRRNLQVKVEEIPATDQTRIVYSLRAGFGRFSPTGAAAGIEGAAVLYNIA